jgi:hypothetical protein
MKNRHVVWARANLTYAVLAFLLGSFALFLAVAPVQAETYPVDSFEDVVDSIIGDGDCSGATISGGNCTLRAAIQESNFSTSTTDIIVLPPGVYTLTINGPDEDEAATGDLDITSNIVISGSGANTTTIQGEALWDDRIFDILGTDLSIISRVTISGGNLDGSGGGLLHEDNFEADMEAGILNLSECRITNNRSTQFGGGVNSSGVLVVDQCTIDANRTEGDATARGGGIYISTNASLVISNSTVSSNTAQGIGGGIDLSNDSDPSRLNNVTIANNRLLDLDVDEPDGAGLNIENPIVNIYNSLLAGNKTGSGTNNDCKGEITVLKFSLIEVQPDECTFETASDNKIGVSPGIGPLADNGGPTPTHALLDNSPALDSGNPAAKNPNSNPESCYPTDQRDSPRFGRCDIGAYETFVPRQDQFITFNPLSNRTLDQSPFNVAATASSGLPVSFASSTPAVCTVSGSEVTLEAIGTCTIVASQDGDDTFNPATPVSRSFTVSEAPASQFIFLPLVEG